MFPLEVLEIGIPVYNEYTDLHQCEVESHICAAFLEMSGMTKANGMHNDQAQG